MIDNRTHLDRFGLSAPRTALLENRNIMLAGEICTAQAERVVEELLYVDYTQPGSPVTLNLVDSPGGSVSAGYAVLDTARRVRGPVTTVAAGMCASMAAVLLICAGERGRRLATPNATIMIHQPSGVAQGQSTDVAIAAQRLQRTRGNVERLISEASGLPVERVHELCERDTFFSAEEALELGLIDRIVGERAAAA